MNNYDVYYNGTLLGSYVGETETQVIFKAKVESNSVFIRTAPNLNFTVRLH